MRDRMIRIACLGALALAAGCVSTERETVPAEDPPGPAPEPGTRAYFERHITGKYALDRDTVVFIQDSGLANTNSGCAFWMEGDLLDCLDGIFLLSVAGPQAPGGTAARQEVAISPLDCDTNRATSDRLRVLAV